MWDLLLAGGTANSARPERNTHHRDLRRRNQPSRRDPLAAVCASPVGDRAAAPRIARRKPDGGASDWSAETGRRRLGLVGAPDGGACRRRLGSASRELALLVAA